MRNAAIAAAAGVVVGVAIALACLVTMPAQAWVTLVVGLIATAGVLLSWRQKFDADRRGEWWRRVSWSFDHVLSGNADREAFGWVLLDHLAKSSLATKDDAELFQTVAEQWIVSDTEEDTAEEGDYDEDDEGNPQNQAARPSNQPPSP